MNRRVAAPAILLVTLAGCFGGGSWDDIPTPEDVFEITFRTRPGPGIIGLRAKGSQFRDSCECFLRFRATRAQLNTLIGPGFVPLTPTDFADRLQGHAKLPGTMWWAPGTSPTTVLLGSRGFHKEYGTSDMIVSYNPTTQDVHVYWWGLS